jgi:hypothetical protein
MTRVSSGSGCVKHHIFTNRHRSFKVLIVWDMYFRVLRHKSDWFRFGADSTEVES